MSGRCPTFSARSLSPSARLTSAEKPPSDSRAVVLGDVVHHLGIAAPHQHVGHGLADVFAAGEHSEMRLPLGAGELDQFGFLQPRATGNDRAGDGDVVVVGELADQFGRRVGDGASVCAISARALASISTTSRHSTSSNSPM